SLERELEEANATAAKSKVEIDSQTRKLADLETFKQQLAGKLEQREEQLRLSESVIRLLRGEQPASAPDLPVAPPVAHIDLEPGPVQDGSPAVMPDAGSAVPQTLGS